MSGISGESMEVLTAYVIGGDRLVTDWLNKSPFIYAVDGADDPRPSIEEYQILVFTGGEDIDPKYYGQQPISSYPANNNRDVVEMSWFFKTKHTHYH